MAKPPALGCSAAAAADKIPYPEHCYSPLNVWTWPNTKDLGCSAPNPSIDRQQGWSFNEHSRSQSSREGLQQAPKIVECKHTQKQCWAVCERLCLCWKLQRNCSGMPFWREMLLLWPKPVVQRCSLHPPCCCSCECFEHFWQKVWSCASQRPALGSCSLTHVRAAFPWCMNTPNLAAAPRDTATNCWAKLTSATSTVPPRLIMKAIKLILSLGY